MPSLTALFSRRQPEPEIAAGRWTFPRALLPEFIIVAALAIAAASITVEVWPGSIAAALVYAVLLMLWIARQRRDAVSMGLFGLAALSGVAVLLEPGPLNLFVAWVALSLAAMRQRGVSFFDLRPVALHLARRLAGAIPASVVDGVLGAEAVLRRLSAGNAVRYGILPAAAVGVFLALFMVANPLLDRYVHSFSLAWLEAIDFSFVVLAVVFFIALWSIFSDRFKAPAVWLDAREAPAWHGHYFSVPAIVTTLVLLNGLFAVQNALDVAFLWSGAKLPEGLTHAEYVHRGAFTLIFTAILAGMLVIVALWPGSPGERYPLVRRLVYLWVLQNVFLVASSAARTLAYVDDYGLTIMRLAGLIWMGVVAAGLVFIVARIVLDRSTRWLVNVNAVTAFGVLFVCGFLDMAGTVATYNVDRAIRSTAPFDLRYAEELGPSSLPALTRLVAPVRHPDVFYPISWRYAYTPMSFLDDVRGDLRAQLKWYQRDWRTWTLRGALIQRSLPTHGLQR